MANDQNNMKEQGAPVTRRIFLRHMLTWSGMAVSLLLPHEIWAADAAKGKTKIKAAVAVTPLPQRKPAPPRLLMIDPGHGGRDPGAIGARGTYEKDITLDVARRLAQKIAGQQGVDARMTREKDTFIPLADRVQITREARADMFVSIHADSAPNSSARGLSAYTLASKASDDFAKALATQENKADAMGGLDLGLQDEEVTAILMDLTARHTRNAAQRAKVSLISGIGGEWQLLDNPMRSANFVVLRAPDVPSILIETGFLSNKKDEELLRQPQMRDKIAGILARELADVIVKV